MRANVHRIVNIFLNTWDEYRFFKESCDNPWIESSDGEYIEFITYGPGVFEAIGSNHFPVDTMLTEEVKLDILHAFNWNVDFIWFTFRNNDPL